MYKTLRIDRKCDSSFISCNAILIITLSEMSGSGWREVSGVTDLADARASRERTCLPGATCLPKRLVCRSDLSAEAKRRQKRRQISLLALTVRAVESDSQSDRVVESVS